MTDSIIPINEHGLVYTAYSELELIAKKILDSGISRAGNTAQICLIILRGRSLGLDMWDALENVAVINNKTTLSGDLAMALVERSGLIEDKAHVYSGKGAERSCSVTVIRKGRTSKTWSYSIAEAKQAGLLDRKSSPWLTFPDRMLYYRALGFALRGEFPDVLRGMHLTEEFDRIDSSAQPEEKPAKVIEAEPPAEPAKPAPQVEEISIIENNGPSYQARLLELANRDGITEELLLQVLRRMKHVEINSIAELPPDKANLFCKNWEIIRLRAKSMFRKTGETNELG